MVENSKIEWTDHTFNPWMGCTAVSPACDHCYAEAQTARFKQVGWGAHADRKRTSAANWRLPLLWNDKAQKSGVRFKVFCASLADVFDNHKSILPQWRYDLWSLIRATPNLDWLLLTKRPQNIERYLPSGWWGGYPNVWLGVTVENQIEAERRIPILLNTSATKRFLSCEPLLGPIIFADRDPIKLATGTPAKPEYRVYVNMLTGWGLERVGIDWVICGGESGAHARPMHPDWARSLRDQCKAASVPFFFKQWGAWAPILDRAVEDPDWRAGYGKYERSDRHCFLNLEGGSGFHGDRLHVMERRGFKNAGHLLDGQEWRQMPGVESNESEAAL